MSEILVAVCDVCGKRQECASTNMPPDWFRVRSYSYDLASDNARADVEGDACSRDCRAALLRKALILIAAPTFDPCPHGSVPGYCAECYRQAHPGAAPGEIAPGVVGLREGSPGSGRYG